MSRQSFYTAITLAVTLYIQNKSFVVFLMNGINMHFIGKTRA